MTIWHPFHAAPGHRPGDATQGESGDLPSWVTGPWTPQALAETQLDMWRHAAAATHAWWQYMTVAWPAWPVGDTSVGTPVETPASSVARTDVHQHTGEDAPARRPVRKAAAKRPKRAGR